MTCAKCGKPYDAVTIEGKLYHPLVCPHCAAGKSRDALRLYQIQLLPLVVEGKDVFTLHLTGTGMHAQMFGRKTFKTKNQTWRAFCGAPANAGRAKRFLQAYQARGWERVCEKCREAIEELLAEAREQEAIKTQ